MTMQVPVIAIDGSESTSGRALLCLSALYHCSDSLRGVKLRLIDVADADVRLAAEALHWDVGLALDVRPAESNGKESPLDGVSLYAGIACGSARHMRLDEAIRRDIPTMVAMQFPDKTAVPRDLELPDEAAFDPKLFAEALVETVGRLDAPLDTGLASALVARQWYLETYRDVAAAGADPVEHYFTHGWREGRNPNAWFATRWYLARNRKANESGVSPLHHFVREGARAGCRPHPRFNVAWYSRKYLGLDVPSHMALRHFLTIGERDGFAPNPALHMRLEELLPALVDADWYRTTYPDVGGDPAQHYFATGWREGRDPNAWFAAGWYLEQNPQAREADSPLHHFVHHGASAGRRPHPDFNIMWYSRHHLGLGHPSPAALHHFLTIGIANGCVPNPGLRAIRDRLPRHSATERSSVLKRLAALQRAARTGKRWTASESELWPVLLAREVPEDRIIVLVLLAGQSEAILDVARLLGQALPIHEFPLFARIKGSNRLRIIDKLDDPQVTLVIDLPGQVAGLRNIAQALPVGRAVVTDDKLRHGDHVRWLRDAGIPVFINGPRDDPDD